MRVLVTYVYLSARYLCLYLCVISRTVLSRDDCSLEYTSSDIEQYQQLEHDELYSTVQAG